MLCLAAKAYALGVLGLLDPTSASTPGTLARNLSLRPFLDAAMALYNHLRANDFKQHRKHTSKHPTHPSSLHFDIAAMCSRRHVCYIYSRCGHAYTMPEQIVQCDSPRCVFSPNHPASCSGSSCKKTCWQYRQPTEQYSPQIEGYCPTCARS